MDQISGTIGDEANSVAVGKDIVQSENKYSGITATFNQENAAVQIFDAVQGVRSLVYDFKLQMSSDMSELKAQFGSDIRELRIKVELQATTTKSQFDVINDRVAALERSNIVQERSINEVKQDGVSRKRQQDQLGEELHSVATKIGKQDSFLSGTISITTLMVSIICVFFISFIMSFGLFYLVRHFF